MLRKGNVFTPVYDSVQGGGVHPPGTHTSQADTSPPRPLQRTVRILLECILVYFLFGKGKPTTPEKFEIASVQIWRNYGSTQQTRETENKTRRPFQMNANGLVVDSLRFIVNKFKRVWAGGCGGCTVRSKLNKVEHI